MKALKKLNLAFILIFLIYSFAFSQPLRYRLYEELDLTDKQIDEINKLRDEHFKSMSDLRNNLQKLYIDMRSEWRNPKPDKKKLESIQDKINDIRNKMSKQRLNHWFDIYNLLDDSQKEKFKKFRAEFFGRFLSAPLSPKQKEKIIIKKRFPGRGLGPCGMGFDQDYLWFYNE